MIYEHCRSLIFFFFFFFFYLMSSSSGYTIQTYLFYFLFSSCRSIVDMFENKSKSVSILILLFNIGPP